MYSLAGFQLFSEKRVEEGKYLLLVLSASGDDRAWENKSGSWWARVTGERSGGNLICFLVEKGIKGLGKKRAILLISQRRKMKATYSMNITPQLSMQSRLFMPASQFDPEH